MHEHVVEPGHMLSASMCRYIPDNEAVVDPYAASALKSSSRPMTPQVVPGGLRGPAQQTGDTAAKWAAAALRGSRGLLGGFSGQSNSQGAGVSSSQCVPLQLLWCTISEARG